VTDELQRSLKYFSDKIDDFEEKMSTYEDNVIALDKKCNDLQNKCKHLELKNDVLEQKFNQIEQNKMSNKIEICGITQATDEDVLGIVKIISTFLEQKPEDIKAVFRKISKRTGASTATTQQVTQPQAIVVDLQEGCREKWLAAAKNKNFQDVALSGNNANIYLREALSPATAFLLWKSKTELRNTGLCKYVWCKNGTILARKEEKDRPSYIRSESDIGRIKNMYKGTTKK
jgi:hypothetical protein